MTHILIPREPSTALLRPFVGCPQEELPQAYAAMIRIAEVQHARAGTQGLAQIEESAGAAPDAVAPQGEWRIDTSAGREILVYKGCSVIEEADARYVLSLIAAASQPAAAAAAAPTLDVTLDEDQAGLLRDMLGDPAEYEEALTVRLIVCDGHSGHGLYVAQAEYQDEGAALLAPLPATASPALEAPAAPVCERCGLSPAEHNPTHWCDNQSFAAAAPQAPAAPSVNERAAYIEFLTSKFPRSYGREEAGRWWDQGHVSALTWQAARAAPAAPAAPAVDVLSPERMREEFIAWAEVAYRHEEDFTKRDFEICLKAWRFGSANALLAAQAAAKGA